MRLSMDERKEISYTLLAEKSIDKVPGMYDLAFALTVEMHKEPHYFEDVKGMTENLDLCEEHRDVTLRVSIVDMETKEYICEVAYMKLKLVDIEAQEGNPGISTYDDKGCMIDILPLLSTDAYKEFMKSKRKKYNSSSSQFYVAELNNLYVSPSFRKRGIARTLIKNLNEYLYRDFRGQIILLGVYIKPIKDQFEIDMYLDGVEKAERCESMEGNICAYVNCFDFISSAGFKCIHEDDHEYEMGYWYKSYI